MPFLNQRKGENDRRKYFMINLHERMLSTSAGVEPATSWSPVGWRWRSGNRGFNPRRGRQHSFVEIDQEIFSTVILSLPLMFLAEIRKILYTPYKPQFYYIKMGFKGIKII